MVIALLKTLKPTEQDLISPHLEHHQKMLKDHSPKSIHDLWITRGIHSPAVSKVAKSLIVSRH